VKLEIGKTVEVINPYQINYPFKGVVIETDKAPDGTKMSKVKFWTAKVWYLDEDLKEAVK
jgi:hypothetical protein